MNRSLGARAAVAVLALPLAAAMTATPAAAASMSFSKSSGRLASAAWLEVGTLPGGVPGNIHFGDMQVEELSGGRANVFGVVIDMTCPDGYIPDGPGGGHGLEEDPVCSTDGFRFIDGGSLSFSMDKRFDSARLTGTLDVFGHDGPAGSPPVDMTWTGQGATTRSSSSGSYSDGTTTYSYRYDWAGRSAQVSGNIGVMVFDDEPGERSSAQLASYKSRDRSRTR